MASHFLVQSWLFVFWEATLEDINLQNWESAILICMFSPILPYDKSVFLCVPSSVNTMKQDDQHNTHSLYF